MIRTAIHSEHYLFASSDLLLAVFGTVVEHMFGIYGLILKVILGFKRCSKTMIKRQPKKVPWREGPRPMEHAQVVMEVLLRMPH